MPDTTIAKTIFIAATPETVWEILTEKDKLAAWFHPAAADLEAGADFELVGKADDGAPTRICWGTVEIMEPPTHLAYSFTLGPLDGRMTRVEWQLDAVPGGTRLNLRHSGLEATEGAFGLTLALDKGWDDHLGRLRAAAGVG